MGSDGQAAALATSTAGSAELDPVAAARIEPANRRRLVRALEVTVGSGRPFSSFGPGLERYPPTAGCPGRASGTDPDELDRRIAERFDRLMEPGLLDEVRALAARPAGLSRTARQALGLPRAAGPPRGAACPWTRRWTQAIRRTRTFARRQLAWFRRDPRIVWVDPETTRWVSLLAPVRRGAPSPGTGGRLDHSPMSPPMPETPPLHLTKHHGAGNDFLVLLDLDDRLPWGPRGAGPV